MLEWCFSCFVNYRSGLILIIRWYKLERWCLMKTRPTILHRLSRALLTLRQWSLELSHLQIRCFRYNIALCCCPLCRHLNNCHLFRIEHHIIRFISFKGRLFSYHDTHLHRLGTNYLQLPVNCPYKTRVSNYQRDGPQTFENQSKLHCLYIFVCREGFLRKKPCYLSCKWSWSMWTSYGNFQDHYIDKLEGMANLKICATVLFQLLSFFYTFFRWRSELLPQQL